MCQRLREIWNSRAAQLNLTQEVAAERMGITQGGVGHFLAGRNKLHVEAVFWFADMLRVHPLEIDPKLSERLPGNLRIALTHMPERTDAYRMANAPAAPLQIHEPRIPAAKPPA